MPWRGEQMGTAVELEACGQHMDQGAADELVSSQRHHLISAGESIALRSLRPLPCSTRISMRVLSMSQTLSETTSETRSPGPLPALIGAPLERIVGSQCFHVGERQVLNRDSFDEVSAMAIGYRQSTPTLYPV
jgi:hypothetical protein